MFSRRESTSPHHNCLASLEFREHNDVVLALRSAIGTFRVRYNLSVIIVHYYYTSLQQRVIIVYYYNVLLARSLQVGIGRK